MVTSREWQRVGWVWLALALLTTAPYIVGWAAQPEGQFFSGHVVGVEDGYSYLGKMRLGAMGRWAFHIFYTTEPHDAEPLTFLPYILPGQFLRPFVDTTANTLYTPMILTFHALRLLWGGLLVAAVYRFVATFLAGPGPRLTATVVALVGGGWGWLVLFTGAAPPEWLIPEAFGLHLLYTLPHLALARACTLAGFLALFASLGDNNRNHAYALLAGALWTVGGLASPISFASVYAVLGIWGVLLWVRARAFPLRPFVRALIAFLVTLPVFGFYMVAFNTNPVFAQWSAQNILRSPPPPHYLAAYGGLLLLGAFAVRRAWATERGTLLLAWVLVGLTLIYLPINVQRRLGEGVLVPLAVLAVWGIGVLVESRGWKRWRLRAALCVWAFPTVILFYAATWGAVLTQNPDLYAPAAEVRAMWWLDDNAVERERGAVVLTRFDAGNILPAYTNLRPVVGHGPETLYYQEKEALTDRYFEDALTAAERAALYDEYTVDYVLFVPGDEPPAWASATLEQLYDEDGVTIFAVP